MTHSEVSTVARTGRGDSFEEKVVCIRNSVMFVIVTDVVSKEASRGLPWELLCTDDLIKEESRS